jgi:hypothetical protein
MILPTVPTGCCPAFRDDAARVRLAGIWLVMVINRRLWRFLRKSFQAPKRLKGRPMASLPKGTQIWVGYGPTDMCTGIAMSDRRRC